MIVKRVKEENLFKKLYEIELYSRNLITYRSENIAIIPKSEMFKMIKKIYLCSVYN